MSIGTRLRYTLVVLTALFFQVGVLTDFRVLGVEPDVTLLLATTAGLVSGPHRGAIIGFWSGLAYDLTLPGPVGIRALVWALVGFSSGIAEEVVNAQSRLMCALFVLGASTLGLIGYVLAGEVFGLSTLGVPDLPRIVGLVSVMNAAMSTVAISIAHWCEDGDTNLRTTRL